MKSDCSLDLLFTNNFSPFDLWMWISNIKSSWFPCPPQPTWNLLFPWPLSSTVWFFVVVWHSIFFFLSSYSIPMSFTTEISLLLLFQHLWCCLLCPEVPSVCALGLSSGCPISSVTMVQAFIPPLYLLPVFASAPHRFKSPHSLCAHSYLSLCFSWLLHSYFSL